MWVFISFMRIIDSTKMYPFSMLENNVLCAHICHSWAWNQPTAMLSSGLRVTRANFGITSSTADCTMYIYPFFQRAIHPSISISHCEFDFAFLVLGGPLRIMGCFFIISTGFHVCSVNHLKSHTKPYPQKQALLEMVSNCKRRIIVN